MEGYNNNNISSNHQQQQQQQFFAHQNEIMAEYELYQALSDTFLDDDNDLSTGFLSNANRNNNNTNNALEVFFNPTDYILDHPTPYMNGLYANNNNNSNTQASISTTSPLFPSFPIQQTATTNSLVQTPLNNFSSLFCNDIFSVNDIESSKKRCLDEFDEPEQAPSSLFPDTFQKRKIAKNSLPLQLINKDCNIIMNGNGNNVNSSIGGNGNVSKPVQVFSAVNIMPINTAIPSPVQSNASSSSSTATVSTLSLASSSSPHIVVKSEPGNDAETIASNDISLLNSASVRKWTTEEDNLLLQAVRDCGSCPPKCWKAIAKKVPGRNEQQCLQRWKNVLACTYNKGIWTTVEDDILRECQRRYGDADKEDVAGKKAITWDIKAAEMIKRTPKQCRERWANILDPTLRNEEFTEEEDQKIISLQKEHGNKWKMIASFLKGRTGNRVKSRFNSLSRKLKE